MKFSLVPIMKYLAVSLFSAVFLIGICQGAIPSEKCREDYRAQRIKEECILHCEYAAYGFVSDKYEIQNSHITKFVQVLMKRGVVDTKNRKELRKVLRTCARKATPKNKDNKDTSSPDCFTVYRYYTCIVENELIPYMKYENAIIAYDKTIRM